MLKVDTGALHPPSLRSLLQVLFSFSVFVDSPRRRRDGPMDVPAKDS